MAQYNLGRVIGTMWYVGSASSDTAIKAEISGEERKPLEDDCYLNISTGDIYQYEDKGSSLEWTLKGNIKGPQGNAGADGKNGTNGKDGVAGENGTDGATWTSGASVPSNTNGKDGDFYLNTSNWDVYKKTAGSWSKVGNIKGATGNAGTNGANGADGKTPTLSINEAGELIATFAD